MPVVSGEVLYALRSTERPSNYSQYAARSLCRASTVEHQREAQSISPTAKTLTTSPVSLESLCPKDP